RERAAPRPSRAGVLARGGVAHRAMVSARAGGVGPVRPGARARASVRGLGAGDHAVDRVEQPEQPVRQLARVAGREAGEALADLARAELRAQLVAAALEVLEGAGLEADLVVLSHGGGASGGAGEGSSRGRGAQEPA